MPTASRVYSLSPSPSPPPPTPAQPSSMASGSRHPIASQHQHHQQRQGQSSVPPAFVVQHNRPAPSVPIVGGSGARVPTQLLDQRGGFSRDVRPKDEVSTHGSTEDDFVVLNNTLRASMPRSSGPSPMANGLDMMPNGQPTNAGRFADAIDLTAEDGDGFTVIGARGPAVLDSEQVVCIGLLYAGVLSVFGLPESLISPPPRRLEDYNAHPKWDPRDWPAGSGFYLEPGYRPIELLARPVPRPEIAVFEVMAPYDVRIALPHEPDKGPRIRTYPFGSISDKIARSLCRLLFDKKIRISARCRIRPPGPQSYGYYHPVELLCFAQRKDVDLISNALLQENIALENPDRYDPDMFPGRPPLELPYSPIPVPRRTLYQPMLQSRGTLMQMKEATEQEKRKQVDSVYASLPDGESLPEKEVDKTLITTELLSHQKRALTFLLDREKARSFDKDGRGGEIVSLWKPKWRGNRIVAYQHVVTQGEQMRPPHICQGAILADDMGLGKTLTTISLIADTYEEARLWSKQKPLSDTQVEEPLSGPENGKDEDDEDVTIEDFSINMSGIPPAAKKARSNGKEKKKGKREIHREEAERLRLKQIKKRSRATLIVLPLTLVSAWEGQVHEHWKGDKQPKIYVHHGPSRLTDPNRIAKNHIVFTTYSTLAAEYSITAASEGESEDEEVDEQEDIVQFSDIGDPLAPRTAAEKAALIKKEQKARKRKRKVEKRKRKGEQGISPLQQIEWFRIVLDEAHTIKEPRTLQSRAVCHLIARSRLCLTGTPVQNKIEDLFALVKFLRLEPFDDRGVWNQFCGSKEAKSMLDTGRRGTGAADKNNEPLDSMALARVQTLMKFLTLRRTKETRTADGNKLLELPPKFSRVLKLDFEDHEKATYNEMRQRYKDDFEQMKKDDTLKYNYATILHEISNLRMTCDHMELVHASKDLKRSKEMPAGASDPAAAIRTDGISRDRAVLYFDLLCSSDQAVCSICSHDLSSFAEEAAGRGSPLAETNAEGKKPVLLRCTHIFCSDCLRSAIGTEMCDKPTEDARFACPACGIAVAPLTEMRTLMPGDVEQNDRANVLSAEKFGADIDVPIDKRSDYSTKIRALVQDLEVFSRRNPASRLYDPNLPHLDQVAADATEKEIGREEVYVAEAAAPVSPIKSIVFSQWTSMLDRIARAVHRAGIRAASLDGRMRRQERNDHLDRFKNDPSVEVLLVSLKAGGVGLNLVSACRAYLMEPYWNPATENQGLDRIHRMGQLRPVVTTKYIMSNSIEEKMLDLQRRKTQLAESVGAKRRGMLQREEELNILFGDSPNEARAVDEDSHTESEGE